MDRPRWPADQPDHRSPAERERQHRIASIRAEGPWLRDNNPPRPSPDPPPGDSGSPDPPGTTHGRRPSGPDGNPPGRPPPDGRPDSPDPTWYQEHLARTDPPDAWYRFKVQCARDVPNRPDDPGGKTRGLLDLPDGRRISLGSGKDGPSKHVGMPGKNRYNEHHVESHAAATMRETGAPFAVLYINKRTCAGRWYSCHQSLPDQLPEGAALAIYGPRGFTHIYRGHPDPPDHP